MKLIIHSVTLFHKRQGREITKELVSINPGGSRPIVISMAALRARGINDLSLLTGKVVDITFYQKGDVLPLTGGTVEESDVIIKTFELLADAYIILLINALRDTIEICHNRALDKTERAMIIKAQDLLNLF